MASKTFVAALAAAFLTSTAAAQTAHPWTGPDESRRGYLLGHAPDNFQTAITEVCFPYLLQNAEANTWVRNYRTYISWRPATGVFSGLTTYQVGGSSATDIGVGERGVDGLGRQCLIEPDERIDPQEALAMLRTQITRMPRAMTQSAHAFAPGAFAERLAWCSPAEGPQLYVLASINPTQRRRGTPAMLVTFVEVRDRDARCDAPPG